MESRGDGISRRGFISSVVGGAAVAALDGRLAFSAGERARIVRVEADGLWNGGDRDEAVVARMVATGLTALTGAATEQEAWKALIEPGARVGLKINLLGRPHVVTAREVTETVAASLIAAGWKPDEVVVWDRYTEHFRRSGYSLGKGRHGQPVEAGGRYDGSRKAPTSGGAVPLDTMVTERTDVTVSLPVLKDHGGAGITGALKNIAFGAYDHHPQAHEGNCDPFIAEAYAHFATSARCPLIMLDATEGCFDGGPRPSGRDRIWRENALYLATDPVAVDVVIRDLVQARRRQAGLADTTNRCRHVATAAGKGLGIGDRDRIDVVTVQAGSA